MLRQCVHGLKLQASSNFIQSRGTMKTMKAALLLLSMFLAGCRSDRRPNVLVISLDTLRAQSVSAYGYSRQTTPAIDRVAQFGALAENFFAQSHYTLPSHATILTGAPSGVHGVDLAVQGQSLHLSPKIKTLAELFEAEGYETAWFANYQDPHLPFTAGIGRGFGRYFPFGIDTPRGMDEFLRWEKEEKKKPFFAFLHSKTPNFPAAIGTMDGKGRFASTSYRGKIPVTMEKFQSLLAAKSKVYESDVRYYQDWLSPGSPVPQELLVSTVGLSWPVFFWSSVDRKSPQELTHMTDLYDDAVTRADAAVGGVIRALKQSGRLENTWIFILSDHGEELGEEGRFGHKTLHIRVAKVPFVVLPPESAGIRRGVRITRAASTVDLAPTVLDAANLKFEAPYLIGRSLLPEMREIASDRPDQAVSTILTDGTWALNSWAVRTSEWAVLRLPGKNPALFDRKNDPLEKIDVSRKNPEKLLELTRAFEDWNFRVNSVRQNL